MNTSVRDLVAQLNAGAQSKEAKPEQKALKKAAAKPRASKSTSSGGPPGSMEPGSAKASRTKVKLKGTGNTVTRMQPTATANAIAAASAAAAAPLDPNTAPLGKRRKDILDCLLKHNGSQLSPAQIKDLLGLQIETDLELLQDMHRHPRITYEGAPSVPGMAAPAPSAPAAWYSYLPEIPGVRDKIGLLNYVRDHKSQALLADMLGRCYLRAAEDLRELKAEGKVFILGHPDADKEVVFVRDMLGMEGVQEDVRSLWFEVCHEHVKDHVPRGVLELQQAVTKAGFRSALANQPVKRASAGGPKERAKRPRQQRINIDKATNAHLPFLFSGMQPKNIDS